MAGTDTEEPGVVEALLQVGELPSIEGERRDALLGEGFKARSLALCSAVDKLSLSKDIIANLDNSV